MHRAQHLRGLSAETCEGPAQIGGIVTVMPAFGGPIGALFHGDEVDQSPLAQRIADQMPPRPHGDPRLWAVVNVVGDQRAPCHLPREPRLIRTVQLHPPD